MDGGEDDNPEKIITHGHENPEAIVDSSVTKMIFTKFTILI